jgi:hypothetical protein
MKVRKGFVSNSSSSSFIIDKKHLTNAEIKIIKNHITEAQKYEELKYSDEYNAWSISETEYELLGRTSQDNFDMSLFLTKIGVPEEVVQWDE